MEGALDEDSEMFGKFAITRDKASKLRDHAYQTGVAKWDWGGTKTEEGRRGKAAAKRARAREREGRQQGPPKRVKPRRALPPSPEF